MQVKQISSFVNQVHSTDDLSPRHALGCWVGDHTTLYDTDLTLHNAIRDLKRPVFILASQQNKYLVSHQGQAIIGGEAKINSLPLLGFAPKISAQQLGDNSFCEEYGLTFPYMCGAMANGIASTTLVEAAADIGILGSFGAAGLSLEAIEKAIERLQSCLVNKPFCFNLIFSPNEKGHEDAVVSLYIKHGIRLVEASAYMQLTLPVIRYRVHGIRRNAAGQIEVPNRIIAKASRLEIAERWFSPPPKEMLAKLVNAGDITQQQAELAAHIPMAQDLTVEADSGGHTDNRPAINILPAVLILRDQVQQQFDYNVPLRVGAAGGIATPDSAMAVFAMGAAYIVTGTVNQACVESGSSDIVRSMLAEVAQTDVAMAPAVDMFEMGVKLQVIKRGTMFAMRGNKLYELYSTYDSIDAIPATQRQQLEQVIFKKPIEEIWSLTQKFFNQIEPQQIEKAKHDAKHKMALIFRWYLGLSSHWANVGEESRKLDYQIWCGPAMGAFNDWTKASWLEQPATRKVAAVALNILYGTAVLARINSLRSQGVRMTNQASYIKPFDIKLSELVSH